MANLSPLAATFDLRYRRAWSLCYQDKREEAENEAADLLLEPQLGPFHQAGMHLLLAMSPSNYVEHAREAVRLYNEISTQQQDTTDAEKEHLGKLLNDAYNMLNLARQDQTRIDREVQKTLAGGMTMDEFHDRQIDDMHKRLDAEGAGEEVAEEAGDAEGSQDASSLTKDSQMTGTDSQRTESQLTDFQRTDSQTTDPQTSESQTTVTDSQVTITGHLDDDEPLPDIVRYKFDEKKKGI